MRRGERDPIRAQPGRTLSNSDTIDHIDQPEDVDMVDIPDSVIDTDIDLPFDSPLGFPEFDGDIHPFNIEPEQSFDGYIGLRSSQVDASKVLPIEMYGVYDSADRSVLTFDIEFGVTHSEVCWVTAQIENTADIGRSEWDPDTEMSRDGQLNIGFEDFQLLNIGGKMGHDTVDIPICSLPGVVKYVSSAPSNTIHGVVTDYSVEVEYQLRANDLYEHIWDIFDGNKLEEEVKA